MNDIIEKISKIGIVPVITIDRVEDAIPLANALCAGGLPCAEITFRTKAAPEAIRVITERFPDMCVGAGTVLNETQVNDAIKAGACFLVSPGLNPHTVTYCQQNNIAIIPGIENSSDIERAIELGLNVVKFFPAEQSGGLGKLKAMSAPYVNMKFMPTGGISENNLLSYLDHPPVIACGGSWMVPKDLIDGGKWDEIERLTRQAVHKMLGFELAHIGVNAEDEKDALQIAKGFSFLFGMPVKEGNSSVFTGKIIEVIKNPEVANHGHIAIYTNYMERAIYYMETILGVTFKEGSERRSENGKILAVYLKEEIAGFGIHLLLK